MQIEFRGRVDYQVCFDAMRQYTALRDADTPDVLWVVEHPPVFTQGLAGRPAHLHDHGAIPVIAADRGGQVTYHGPGQVVVYLLLDLRRLGIHVRELVYRIEQGVIQTLASYGVDGRRVGGAPGIYVPCPAPGAQLAAGPDDRFAGLAKIAALGIKISRGCCYHGVALNVAMDLEPYARIDACGYAGLRSVDLATLGVQTSWQQAAQRLSARLAAHFERPA